MGARENIYGHHSTKAWAPMRNGRKQERASSIADFHVFRGRHSEARSHPPGRPASNSGRGIFGCDFPTWLSQTLCQLTAWHDRQQCDETGGEGALAE